MRALVVCLLIVGTLSLSHVSASLIIEPPGFSLERPALWSAPFIPFGNEKDTSRYTPKIIALEVKVDPIMNNTDPVFKVRDVIVKIPGLMRRDSMRECTIEVLVKSSNIVDLTSGSPYKVIVVAVDPLRQCSLEQIQWARDSYPKPRVNQRELPSEWLPEPPKKAVINADTLRYSAITAVTLKLVDGKIPLRKGQVKGHVVLTYIATFTDSLGIVHRSIATHPVQTTN